MKKVLLLLLFIPLVSFGQDVNLNVDKKVEFTEKKDIRGGYGLSYTGNGVYTYVERVIGKGLSSFNAGYVSETKWLYAQTNGRKSIMNFTNQNNYTYKTINVEKFENISPKRLIMTFKVFNKDGLLVKNKDEAKKEIMELKEYLDLGIITQEEFDKKAVSLKKILLGN